MGGDDHSIHRSHSGINGRVEITRAKASEFFGFLALSTLADGAFAYLGA
jgi:hypothetical protein